MYLLFQVDLLHFTMGRKKTKDFTPLDFQSLSNEEKQLRGRMSTLKRMIETRKERIEVLQKPIIELRTEIKKYEIEFNELKEKLQNRNFVFPTFRVEEYFLKGKPYVRGVWYVKSKKKQFYIGSETDVLNELRGKYQNFDSEPIDMKEKIRYNHYLPQLQLDFWKKEYEGVKGKRRSTTK